MLMREWMKAMYANKNSLRLCSRDWLKVMKERVDAYRAESTGINGALGAAGRLQLRGIPRPPSVALNWITLG